MKLRSANYDLRMRQGAGSLSPSHQEVASAQSSKFEIQNSKLATAFSLLEVLIAMGIFFVAVFSILELTSRNLRAARALQQMNVDVTSLAAEYARTNRLDPDEGLVSGDFGDLYPNYYWTRDTYLIATNGLFQADFTVHWALDKRPLEAKMSILLYRPDSPVSARGVRR